MTPKNECTKCGAAMQEGFITDDRDHDSMPQQIWVEGQPKSSFWSGGLKTSGRATHNVRALRCAGCGFLEFYTDDRNGLDVESYKIFT